MPPARTFANAVAKVRARETALGLGESLTRAVATNLSKLMSYKDEYEVARLYSDPAYLAGLDETLVGRKSIKIWLAPPMIAKVDPHTGHPKKIAFGSWVLSVFKLLQHGKVLRGGPLDLFGATDERKMERDLWDTYLSDLEVLVGKLSAATHKTITEIARLPDDVRGFGHVKAASVVTMKAKREVLMRGLG